MKKVITLFILVFLLFSCKEKIKKDETVILPTDKQSSEMNKEWIKEEHQLINKFIERNQWEVIKTGTGLRYLIYKKGTGKKAEPGMTAMIHYSITLLDGTECYSTKELSPQPFLINQDNLESGLHEAITYMHVGDRAKIIIPSYLAHGLAGDLNKIPTLATIIYDVKLLGLSNTNKVN